MLVPVTCTLCQLNLSCCRLHCILSSLYPVSIRFFPRHRRWPDTPHPFCNRSHTFTPSRSICSFLDLQLDFLHTLFHLSPCQFWLFVLSLPIHFQHHCLLHYIIIISSNHMSIPAYSIRPYHSILRFLQTRHLHQLLHILSIH